MRWFTSKKKLQKQAMQAMMRSSIRIAKVDYRRGTYVYLKDDEQFMLDFFRENSWQDFREIFLPTIREEDREKLRSFLSLENMRRVCEQFPGGDSCIYKRILGKEYQWVQTTIVPVLEEPGCVMVYAKNVDDAMRSEEFYKEHLWEELQKTKEKKNADRQTSSYLLKYNTLSMELLKKEIEESRRLLADGKAEQAAVLLEQMETDRGYSLQLLQDFVRGSLLGDVNRQKVFNVFSIEMLLKDCGRQLETMGNLEIGYCLDKQAGALYAGDRARLSQLLLGLIWTMEQPVERGGELKLKARLENTRKRDDSGDFCDRIGIEVTFQAGKQEKESVAFAARDRKQAGEYLLQNALAFLNEQYRVEVQRMDTGTLRVTFEMMQARPETLVEGSPIKVMTVDDNELNLEMVSESLEANGYEVCSFLNSKEALSHYENSSEGEIQMVITDLVMPNLDGCELTKRIRESGRADSKTICIVGLSGNFHTMERENALEAGMEICLEKPFRIQELEEYLKVRKLGKRT